MTTARPWPQSTTVAPVSDEEVVDRVRGGETALFEVLMRRYNQRLYRAARAILRDDAEAEDVLQQTYLNAYAHLGQFAHRASFATWLTRIAVHEALARRRRRAAFGEVESMLNDPDGEGMPSPIPDPEQEALSGELRSLLEKSIDALPTTYRAVFVLREVEELTTAETAECVGLSEDVVKTRLHRARAMLRKAIDGRVGRLDGLFPFGAERCDRVVARVTLALNALDA
jgi:RNA polymerase sigma-70 factor (ECF subfamily)